MENKDLIDLFEKLTRELEVFNSTQLDKRSAIQTEFNKAIESEWKKLNPRKKFKMSEATSVPGFFEIKEACQNRADELLVDQAKIKSDLEEKIRILVDKIQITDDLKVSDKSKWVKYDSRSTSDYHTQGFGAPKYAKSSAENIVDHVTANGIDAEIRTIHGEPTRSAGWSMESVEYQVFAGCSETVCEIIRQKPGISLREWVKRSWKRGVNPRVVNPFIEVGYEEKVGLDFFGNEVQKQVV